MWRMGFSFLLRCIGHVTGTDHTGPTHITDISLINYYISPLLFTFPSMFVDNICLPGLPFTFLTFDHRCICQVSDNTWI